MTTAVNSPADANPNQEAIHGTNGPADFPDLESVDIVKLLDPFAHDMDMTTIFSSSQAANLAAIPDPLTDGSQDLTIPHTAAQMKAPVKAMSVAMGIINHAEGGDTMKKPFVNGKYSRERMEIACWNALDACIARHVTGQRPRAGIPEADDKPSGRIEAFAERMEVIFRCLAVSSPSSYDTMGMELTLIADTQINLQAFAGALLPSFLCR